MNLNTKHRDTTKWSFVLAIPLVSFAFLTPVSSSLAGGNHTGGHGHESSPAKTQNAGGHHGGGHGHHGGEHGGHGSHGKSAVGGPGDANAVSQTLHVDLLDTMRFQFDQPLALKRGDVVRFVVSNKGQIRHEFSIGNQTEQDAHREAMRGMPNMMHDDPNAVTVDPGQSKTLIWRFDGEDDVVFACNIPGHSEAGMLTKTALK